MIRFDKKYPPIMFRLMFIVVGIFIFIFFKNNLMSVDDMNVL